MKKNNNYYRFTFLAILTFFGSICTMLYGVISPDEVNNYQITCGCYPSYFATTYTAITFDTHNFTNIDRYNFVFEEMSGDLDIDQSSVSIDADDWNHDAWGYYPKTPYNSVKNMNLSFTVLKNDIEPGASRNFRLKYRTREVGTIPWDEWEYSDEFTVSVEDITVSGTAGTLCNSSRSYSISLPTGYTSNWSFSNSTLVTPSSQTNSSTAAITGTCNSIGDGVLTFTMTKTSCPTFTATRTINVNGPDPSDLGFTVKYTNGTTAPYNQMCPYTHYHIYLDNDASASCGVSSLTWTIPAGWTKNYQSSNMISIYTNSSPGGQVIVKGQTCCSGCGSNMSLTTGYFGIYYSCGGYYMASPNPGSDYIDIDVDPFLTSALSATTDNDISLTVVDKMGTIVLTDKVTSLPYRIETSKLQNGEYFINIRTVRKGGTTKEQRVEAIEIIISH